MQILIQYVCGGAQSFISQKLPHDIINSDVCGLHCPREAEEASRGELGLDSPS